MVALRGKVYSIKTIGLDMTPHAAKQACAGVKRSVVKQSLSHDLYKETLLGDGSGRPPQDRYINQTTIRSKAHQVSTITQHKVGLSALDQKRYVLWDNIHTYPFGHKNIIHEESVSYEKFMGPGPYRECYR